MGISKTRLTLKQRGIRKKFYSEESIKRVNCIYNKGNNILEETMYVVGGIVRIIGIIKVKCHIFEAGGDGMGN